MIEYHIFSADIFLLGEESGILYPHKSLMGNTAEFQLVIEAKDGDGPAALSDRAIINIQVMNVNEHQPTFILPALSNATIEVTEVRLLSFYSPRNDGVFCPSRMQLPWII